ncbi:hypothetical protein SUNI508_06286 [Seiridium unicorne]|uniref:Uncharacterized protein n=1 Tax=Seiridium unicorne TaxID=138068 RepID=A0ABR2V1J4_9PEZI
MESRKKGLVGNTLVFRAPTAELPEWPQCVSEGSNMLNFLADKMSYPSAEASEEIIPSSTHHNKVTTPQQSYYTTIALLSRAFGNQPNTFSHRIQTSHTTSGSRNGSVKMEQIITTLTMFLAAVAVATTVFVAFTGAFAAGFYLAWHYAWAAGHAEGCLKTAEPKSQPLQVEGGRREEAEQGGKPAKGEENNWSCSDHTGFWVGGHVPQLMRNYQRLPRPALNSRELTSKFRSSTTRHSSSTNNMALAAMNPFSLSANAFCTITTPASTAAPTMVSAAAAAITRIAAAAATSTVAAGGVWDWMGGLLAAAAIIASFVGGVALAWDRGLVAGRAQADATAAAAAPAPAVPPPPPTQPPPTGLATGLGDRQAAWVGGWVRWGVLGPINGFKRGLFG